LTSACTKRRAGSRRFINEPRSLVVSLTIAGRAFQTGRRQPWVSFTDQLFASSSHRGSSVTLGPSRQGPAVSCTTASEAEIARCPPGATRCGPKGKLEIRTGSVRINVSGFTSHDGRHNPSHSPVGRGRRDWKRKRKAPGLRAFNGTSLEQALNPLASLGRTSPDGGEVKVEHSTPRFEAPCRCR